MTKRITKEQYEKLQPYEKNIKNAVKNSFVHMTGSEFEKVAVIYAEIFGQALTKAQRGCNTCRLNALKRLGEVYNEYNQEHKEETADNKPKKTGRPKKLTEFRELLKKLTEENINKE